MRFVIWSMFVKFVLSSFGLLVLLLSRRTFCRFWYSWYLSICWSLFSSFSFYSFCRLVWEIYSAWTFSPLSHHLCAPVWTRWALKEPLPSSAGGARRTKRRRALLKLMDALFSLNSRNSPSKLTRKFPIWNYLSGSGWMAMSRRLSYENSGLLGLRSGHLPVRTRARRGFRCFLSVFALSLLFAGGGFIGLWFLRLVYIY